MKKKYIENSDYIDLNKLLKIIWDGKIKIFSIIIITFIIGFGYSYRVPATFESSIKVKVGKNKNIKELHEIYNYLFPGKEVSFLGSGKKELNDTSGNRSLLIDKATMQEEFINELMDYEELVSVLENNGTVKEKLSQKSRSSKPKILYDYATSLTIKKSNNMEKDIIILEFIWTDAQEATDIIDQTLKLVSVNLGKSIFQHLDSVMQIKKNQLFSLDLKRLEFLLEQRAIAKELKIEDSYFQNSYFQTSRGFTGPYYLNGYKAIDKEIEVLKNRNYKSMTNIEENITTLKNTEINWIDYNIFLFDTRSLKSSKTIYMASIFLGFMIGVFYVVISTGPQYQKVSRKRRAN